MTDICSPAALMGHASVLPKFVMAHLNALTAQMSWRAVQKRKVSDSSFVPKWPVNMYLSEILLLL